MALCPKACVSSSRGECSSSESGSRCLKFGVRSYLHHFYEECSSTMWDRDQEGEGSVQRWWSGPWLSSAVWKVFLALGLLLLTAGVSTLSVGYATPLKIESFGEGDLFFVDSEAINFNRGLHLSTSAGIGVSCLGLALTVMGAVVWVWPRFSLKDKLFHKRREEEETRESEARRSGFKDPGAVVTKSPFAEKGKIPFASSKVENVQPTS